MQYTGRIALHSVVAPDIGGKHASCGANSHYSLLGIAICTSLLALLGYNYFQWIRAEKAASLFRENKTSISDKPSLKNLPAIEPMKMEHALILEEIGGLSAKDPKASKPWFPPYPPDLASHRPQEMDFTVEYGAKRDDLSSQPGDMPVGVWFINSPTRTGLFTLRRRTNEAIELVVHDLADCEVCSETSSNSRRSNAPMGTFLSKARLR